MSLVYHNNIISFTHINHASYEGTDHRGGASHEGTDLADNQDTDQNS